MKIVRVAAAVICDGSRIFATARGYGDYKGFWEFPGGKIEPGESPEEALKREILEELDTEIEVGGLIDTIEYDYSDFHLSMDCFRCRLVKGDLVLKEALAAKWLTKDELNSVPWLPADLTLIGKIREKWDAQTPAAASGTTDADASDWPSLSPEEKKRRLYLNQKKLLDDFLTHGAITRAQYEKSLGDLTEKMGM